MSTEQPLLKVIKPHPLSKPLLTLRERKAYAAAHAILAMLDQGRFYRFAFPSRRKVEMVDEAAQIILEGWK